MELDDRVFPLTRRQFEMWLAEETGRADGGLHLGELVRIEGSVDADLLETAIRHVVCEAEPLRATFFQLQGEVFQKPSDYSDLELPRHDLTSLQDPTQEVHRLAADIQRTPMPLSGQLFKFELLQTRADDYLLACCHHIVADGIGLGLVCHRIAAVYSALAGGEEIPSAFFGSLQDLIQSESEYEASAEYLDDQAYWTRNLPTDSASTYRATHAAAGNDPDEFSAPCPLASQVVAQIDQLSRDLGVRRSSVITAACALLVEGYDAERSEVVLDFPVSRRVSPETKLVPGLISDVVPLVLKTSANSTVQDFCQHVDTRMREALQHQRFPVQALENKARLRSSGQIPNRVVVNFIPAAHMGYFAGDLATGTLTNAGFGNQPALIFFRDDDQLFLSTMGGGPPFANLDASYLAGRLERLLAAMIADPSRRLSSVELIDGFERAGLERWGNRAVLTRTAPAPVSIPAVFAAQVAAAPGAVALTCRGRSWTYAELDAASNRVAHLLAELGAGPGQCVALLFSRSAEAIIAMLGVLKTGAAYLPIDPAHPGSRIEFMIADAAPMAALTTAGLAERLAELELVVIDVDDPRLDEYPGTGLSVPAADDWAYVIYTSGTTGVPKGVAITHANVTELMGSLEGDWAAAGQVWSQWHSYSFDILGVGDLWRAAAWGPAGCGARGGGGFSGGRCRPC